MSFYKAPKPEIHAVSLHGVSYEVLNGFIEVPEAVYLDGPNGQVDIAGRIDHTLRQELGWKLADEREVSSAVEANDAAERAQTDLDERTRLLNEMRDAGVTVDARRNLKWIRERHAECAKQGLFVEPVSTNAPPEPAQSATDGDQAQDEVPEVPEQARAEDTQP